MTVPDTDVPYVVTAGEFASILAAPRSIASRRPPAFKHSYGLARPRLRAETAATAMAEKAPVNPPLTGEATSFAGIYGAYAPPDTSADTNLAVGMDYVLVTSRTSAQFFMKTDGSPVNRPVPGTPGQPLMFDLGSLFNAKLYEVCPPRPNDSATPFVYDSRSIYDPLRGRFIISTLGQIKYSDGTTLNYTLTAVSRSEDPMSTGWAIYGWPSGKTPSDQSDYLALAVHPDVFAQINSTPNVGYFHLATADLNAMANGEAVRAFHWAFTDNPHTGTQLIGIQAVSHHGASGDPLYVVGIGDGDSEIAVWTIDRPLMPPPPGWVMPPAASSMTTYSFDPPLPGPQPPMPAPHDTRLGAPLWFQELACRPLKAVHRNGRIFVICNQGLPSQGLCTFRLVSIDTPAGGGAFNVIYDVSPTTDPEVAAGNATWGWGAVEVGHDGRAGVVFSTVGVSAGAYPSAYATSFTDVGGMATPAVFAVGESVYQSMGCACAAGAHGSGPTHSGINSYPYVVDYGGPPSWAPNAQQGWSYCDNCGQLYFVNGGAGACPAGGQHTTSFATVYWIPFGVSPGAGQQNGWRFCSQCHSLVYGASTGACPGATPPGGPHETANSFDYVLAFLPTGTSAGPEQQQGWQYCSKCSCLALIPDAPQAWADCAGAAVDPADDKSVWVATCYATAYGSNGGNNMAIQFAKLFW